MLINNFLIKYIYKIPKEKPNVDHKDSLNFVLFQLLQPQTQVIPRILTGLPAARTPHSNPFCLPKTPTIINFSKILPHHVTLLLKNPHSHTTFKANCQPGIRKPLPSDHTISHFLPNSASNYIHFPSCAPWKTWSTLGDFTNATSFNWDVCFLYSQSVLCF